MKLSDRVKAARKHAQFTQSQLAERVGIAQTAISQLESGKTLRSSYLRPIAEACGVSVIWLASGLGGMLMSPEQAAFHVEGKEQWEAFEEGMDLAHKYNDENSEKNMEFNSKKIKGNGSISFIFLPYVNKYLYILPLLHYFLCIHL